MLGQLTLILETVTPVFLGGATSGQLAETIRVPSIRGQIRYWLRAILGRKYRKIDQLQEQEGFLFGDTKAGSPVYVRVRPIQTLEVAERTMLPHRLLGTRRPPSMDAFLEKQRFGLVLSPRPGLHTIPAEVLAAVLLWINLGGLGKRSRRGFGSLRLVDLSPPGALVTSGDARELLAARPADATQLRDHIQQLITWVERLVPASGGFATGTQSPYSILHPDMAGIRVGEAASDYRAPRQDQGYWQAMVPFWIDSLRSENKELKDDWAYGHARGGRRASPFHLHLAQTAAGYHLVLTTFWANPSPSRNSAEGWEKVANLLDDCEREWGATTVWGRAL